MKRVMKTGINAVLLAAMIAASGPAAGASLSGREGDARRKIMFSAMMTGGCGTMWQRYVAAAGHSAYAATPSVGIEAFICGAAFNAGSKQAAERRALEQCRAGLKRYKTSAVRLCEIAASK